jgi:hypothetical protein
MSTCKTAPPERVGYVAVARMLAGIALLGVVTVTIASWFLERIGG